MLVYGQPTGPQGYDIIGDVHGEAGKLHSLLRRLGYEAPHGLYRHPEGRQAIFVGDLIDKGPAQLETIDAVRAMVGHGTALAVGYSRNARRSRVISTSRTVRGHQGDLWSDQGCPARVIRWNSSHSSRLRTSGIERSGRIRSSVGRGVFGAAMLVA